MQDIILQFFEYKHLPKSLQTISKPFCEQAQDIIKTIPRNPEREAGLRKLLEAKDCIVRAFLSGKTSLIQCGTCKNKMFIEHSKEERKINCEFCESQLIVMPIK